VSLVSTFLLAPPGWGHAGLALAASTAASFNAMVLWLILKSRGHLLTSRGNRRFVAQLVLANAILATVLIMAQADLHFESLATSTRIKTLAALILGGAFVYLATLLIAGVRPRHLLEPGPH
jgi:putative peptidoglycan lipid II flippase